MTAYIYRSSNEDGKVIVPVVFEDSNSGVRITFELFVEDHDSKKEVTRRGLAEAKRLAALLIQGHFD